MQYLLHYMQYCGGYEPKNCIAGTDVPLLHVYDNDKTWTWIYVCKGITWIEHPVSLWSTFLGYTGFKVAG